MRLTTHQINYSAAQCTQYLSRDHRDDHPTASYTRRPLQMMLSRHSAKLQTPLCPASININEAPFTSK